MRLLVSISLLVGIASAVPGQDAPTVEWRFQGLEGLEAALAGDEDRLLLVGLSGGDT